MSLKARITEDMKSAMRSGEKDRLGLIRMLQAGIKQREVDERITLDDAQKVKLDSIQAKYAKEMPPMTPGEPPSQEAMTKRREVMAKQQDEIRTILTADQQKLYDKNLAEMRDRMGRRPGN